jgi:hypothetical protein
MPFTADPKRSARRLITTSGSHVIVADPEWQNLILAGTWAAANLTTPRFYKDPWGWVHLEGAAYNGALASTIATLPSGYRPEQISNTYICASNAKAVEISVVGGVGAAAGQINELAALQRAAVGDFISLNGIHFRASTSN